MSSAHFMASSIVARRSGGVTSSASRRATYSPDAMARPELRARAAPPPAVSHRISLTLASDAARDSRSHAFRRQTHRRLR
jgi:hypothetical protein